MSGKPQAASAPEDTPAVEPFREVPKGWEPNLLAIARHYCAFAAANL
ncbi:MAG: hydrogenase iron-sulfur subunit, partial [Deltaproteobacteria bacterium]|nr:hydrogenase iron-sulfur subunit [Deltaproteobacteria bacterium]